MPMRESMLYNGIDDNDGNGNNTLISNSDGPAMLCILFLGLTVDLQ